MNAFLAICFSPAITAVLVILTMPKLNEDQKTRALGLFNDMLDARDAMERAANELENLLDIEFVIEDALSGNVEDLILESEGE